MREDKNDRSTVPMNNILKKSSLKKRVLLNEYNIEKAVIDPRGKPNLWVKTKK